MQSVLKIEGMSCENCVKHVKEALEAVAGVNSVEVSLNDKSATIEHRDDLEPSVLKMAVIEEGYEAP